MRCCVLFLIDHKASSSTAFLPQAKVTCGASVVSFGIWHGIREVGQQVETHADTSIYRSEEKIEA